VLRRFSLYGFLKNQQYYEPFLILAFRAKGLSFFVIGLLVAFREAMVNLMEIPSGAAADVWGRRRCMILSFLAYIASFAIFGFATRPGPFLGPSADVALLFLAMFLFAVGDAFRTGTHKAMIFAWLRAQGRTSERTRVYGYTRSWSKYGSAVSVVVAGAFVFWSEGYSYVFFLSIVPYGVGIINFMGYPEELDGEGRADASVRAVVSHLREAVAVSFAKPDLRRLVFESMGFEGVFKAAKDYLQPVLKAAAVALMAGFVSTEGLAEPRKAAVLVGPVYLVLYLLSAQASRHAHRVASSCGGEDRAARVIWGLDLVVFAGLIPAMYFSVHPAMIAGFVLLYVLQNSWRPVLMSRFDCHSDGAQGATVLSIESQAKTVSTMMAAPVLGLAVDLVAAHGIGGAFWPVGALGAAVALLFVLTGRRQAACTSGPSA
jgi:MFS family permease